MKPANAPVSATELEAAGCMARWAARYRSNWDAGPRKGYFQTGTRLHKLVEDYLREGTVPQDTRDPLVELFTEMVPHMPEPKTGHLIEGEKLFTVDGVDFQARPDWQRNNWVVDSKTTKSFSYALKTKEEKARDPQTGLYMRALAPSGGRMTHIYAQKTRAVLLQEGAKNAHQGPLTPRAKRFDADFTEAEVTGNFAPWLELGRELVTLRRKHDVIDPHTMVKNYDRCDDFGGCSYKSTCLVTSGAAFSFDLTAPSPATILEFKPSFSFGGPTVAFNIMANVPGQEKVNPFAKKVENVPAPVAAPAIVPTPVPVAPEPVHVPAEPVIEPLPAQKPVQEPTPIAKVLENPREGSPFIGPDDVTDSEIANAVRVFLRLLRPAQ